MWLFLLLVLAAAWEITYVTGSAVGSGTLPCPAGTIVLGCNCRDACSTISRNADDTGCSFTSASGGAVNFQITCGKMAGAQSYFSVSPSPSIGAGCGNECRAESSTPIAICLRPGAQFEISDYNANSGTPPCPAGTQLLGCQCTQGNNVACQGVTVADNSCLTITGRTQHFCLTVPPTPAPTLPPTVPPTLPPTMLPTVPPTIPPSVPATVPPTMRPTVPATGAPTAPPTVLPTVPTVPPTVLPTVPPTPKTPLNCSLVLPARFLPINCKPLLAEGESCELACRSESVVSNSTVTCLNGSLTALPNLGCPEGGEVQFDIEFESITCGLDLENSTFRLVVVKSLLSLARAALNFPNNQPKVVSTTEINSSSIGCAVWFEQPGDAVTFGEWASVTNVTRSFNVTSIGEPCEVVVIIRNVVVVFFESLFTFLSDLPAWVLFVCVALLLLALVVFLFVNRASEHPFAVLGAIVSIINVASKAVFINFLFRTSDTLSAVGIPDQFFVDASTASVCVLALAFLFNFVVTVRLFTVHYEKNAHDFGPWWAKHRLGVAVVLLLCGLNPASFLILCSSTFNSDLCKGPVSLQAQKRFQVMGLISVLLVDVPFACIQILAYIEVVSSSVLSWSGGTSSVLFGLCFSLVSIALGLVRRTCAVCIAKHPKAKLVELTS